MLYIFIPIYHCGLGRWWWWWWQEEGKHGHVNASEMWRCNATWGRGFHQTMHLHYVAKDTHSKLTLPILLLIKVAKSVVAKKSLFMVATWLQMGEAKASPWRLKGCLKFGNLWSKLWLGPLPWVQAQTWNLSKTYTTGFSVNVSHVISSSPQVSRSFLGEKPVSICQVH